MPLSLQPFSPHSYSYGPSSTHTREKNTTGQQADTQSKKEKERAREIDTGYRSRRLTKITSNVASKHQGIYGAFIAIEFNQFNSSSIIALMLLACDVWWGCFRRYAQLCRCALYTLYPVSLTLSLSRASCICTYVYLLLPLLFLLSTFLQIEIEVIYLLLSRYYSRDGTCTKYISLYSAE